VDILVRNLLDHTKLTKFNKVDSQIAAVLIAAGIASQYTAPTVEAAPPEQTETQWFVLRLPVSGKLAIQCRRPSGETVHFTGVPASYKAGLRHCDSNCGLEILAEYPRRYGAPEVAGDYEAMMAAARNQQQR